VRATDLDRCTFAGNPNAVAIGRCNGRPNSNDHSASTSTRLGMVSNRFTTVERMRSEQTTGLPGRPSQPSKRAVRRRATRARARESARLKRGGQGAKAEAGWEGR
jgi:hypothetical protein